MSRPNGGPAFPGKAINFRDEDGVLQRRYDIYEGMSLRDWFAGQALAGWLSSFPPVARVDMTSPTVGESVAEVAYYFADAMLAERKATR